MAKPIKFKQANVVWKMTADDGEGSDTNLPAYKLDGGDNNQVNISCWQLSFIERIQALFIGKVWLHVLVSQPPVYVGTDFPFTKEPQNEDTSE